MDVPDHPGLGEPLDIVNRLEPRFAVANSRTSLLGFQDRWPPRGLAGAFDFLCEKAANWAVTMPWPEVMRCAVDATLDLAPGDEHEQLQWASAAIGMLVHLRVRNGPGENPQLFNERRQRTRYASYPTPPAIAGVIASHIAAHLKPGSATVLDPTIEGAPILLECARVLDQSVRLIGMDHNPAAIAASDRLFDQADRVAPRAYLQPELVCTDALEAMSALGEIDGLANNPPWGERSRNGRERFAGSSDPFAHFVDLALDQLREGGPFGLVLPGQAATAATAARLRRRLTETCTIDSVTTLPTCCFPRATVRAILILGRKGQPEHSRVFLVRYRIQPLSESTATPTFKTYPQSKLGQDGAPWLRCIATEPPLRISTPTVPLGSLTEITSGIVPYRRGSGRPKQSAELIAEKRYTFVDPHPGTMPVLRSRQVRRYQCLPAAEYVCLGDHLAYTGSHGRAMLGTRVYVRELCSRNGALVAAVAPPGTVPRYGIFTIRLVDSSLDPDVLTAILNSGLIARYVRSSCDGVLKESFNRIRIGDLRRLPVPVTLVHGPLRRDLARISRMIAKGAVSEDCNLATIDELVTQAYEVHS
jgi:hypothetical protein